MPTIFSILGYALLPVAAGTAGGAVAVFRPSGAFLRSCIQHFAAGVVFSVTAVELLPDIMKRHLAWEIGFGFAAGVAAMLTLKKLFCDNTGAVMQTKPLAYFPRMVGESRFSSRLGYYALKLAPFPEGTARIVVQAHDGNLAEPHPSRGP